MRFAYVGVCNFLLSQVGLGGRQSQADIELGESDFDIQISKALDGGDMLIEGGVILGNHMGLKTDAINLDALGAQVLDQLLGSLGLLVGPLEVVIIVVQLGLGRDPGSSLEGEIDVLWAESLIEDRFAVAAVLLKRLVNNIPGIALVLPMPGNVLDVRHDSGPHGLRRPCNVANPKPELTVPNKRVASEDLAGLFGVLGHDLALGEVEDASFGLGEQPLMRYVSSTMIFPHHCTPSRGSPHLHPIRGCCRPELPRFPHDLVILRIRSLEASPFALARRVRGGAKIHQARLFSIVVETLFRLNRGFRLWLFAAVLALASGRGKRQEGSEEKRGKMHGGRSGGSD